MSGLNSILNMAESAIMTQQAALSVTGQNISNVDNADYSVQSTQHITNPSINQGGQIYGTGVSVEQVNQDVNQLLENRLTTEMSSQAGLDIEAQYLATLESLFGTTGDNDLNSLADTYWNSWDALANDPSGDAQQTQVYESGLALTQRFNAMEGELTQLRADVNQELGADVQQVNQYTGQIAALNDAILAAESSGGNANDLRDQRNALVDGLGTLMDIQVTTKGDGSFLVSTSSGLPLVSDGSAYTLTMEEDQIIWNGLSGTTIDITSDITSGEMGGLLEIRDVVIPENQANLDELAKETIWNTNLTHSQGAGQSLYSTPLEGTYTAGESEMLASLFYGDKIDYSKDSAMVIQNGSQSRTVNVDMGLSQAGIHNIQGSSDPNTTYEFTVVDEGVIGDQVTGQAQGPGMGGISSGSGDVNDTLDASFADQTLTVSGGAGGSQEINISDGNRSSAVLAEELNQIDGISAHSSSTGMVFNLDSVTQAQDGDTVAFTLHVDGREARCEFVVDSSQGSLEEQFELALEGAVEEINQANGNMDLALDGLALESQDGATLGVDGFELRDNAGLLLTDFDQFSPGETVTLTVTTDGDPATDVDVEVDLS
ncbi:MAG: flagellar hook-associated protein FlgK, partial [Desulfobacterales bacterium]|nr:flagellar hook-associated protein FlgK [Desulfobacterales bacterium]